MMADEEVCHFVDLARAGVVTEAFPLLQHILEGGGGERGRGWEPFQKPPEVGDDGIHAGLLEHDFGDPDGVGIARIGAPGQVAGISREPRQETPADGGAQRLQVGWGGSGHGDREYLRPVRTARLLGGGRNCD